MGFTTDVCRLLAIFKRKAEELIAAERMREHVSELPRDSIKQSHVHFAYLALVYMSEENG